MDVVIRAKYPWALLPYKQKITHDTEETEVALYAQCFRWLRRTRIAERCWPWRLGQEVGWIVPSPVTVTMTPVRDVEVYCPPEDLKYLGQITHCTEFWERDETFLAIEKTNWLRLYEVNCAGQWETLFVPNGQGSVEWHLGWEIDIPPDYYLMLLPPPILPSGLEIPVGVLTAKTVAALNEKRGISIAARPLERVDIKRGQPIARIILLHKESLQAKAKFEESVLEPVKVE